MKLNGINKKDNISTEKQTIVQFVSTYSNSNLNGFQSKFNSRLYFINKALSKFET